MPRLSPNHLKSTELSYELALRNVDLPATVDEKRKLLRGIIAQESSDKSFIEISNPNEFKDNVKLTHVSQRVQSMPTEDDTEKKTKHDILREVLLLEADPDVKVIVTTTPPVIANPSDGDLFEHEVWTSWHNGHIKRCFSDWQGLVSMFKKTFLHDNYDHVLFNEINSKKQSVREPVSIFISSQEAQFNRLNSPPSENEMVHIICANFLPDYIKALVLEDIYSISELTSL
ncbi:hypothetical protein HHI36_008170 [Cryptolaemus montrouzieri]|uniref:Uncharacterized protein n=1 Tax=Cryptolaemus montrouzieri TaxID=559131 RepID=A0ABD2MRZ2_9CUCU